MVKPYSRLPITAEFCKQYFQWNYSSRSPCKRPCKMSEDGCQTANRNPINTSMNVNQPQRPVHRKTPIQILHEYGIKTGNLPVYTMEKAEGEAHQPSFIFNVKIEDACCSGHGPSKKAAKHRAAEGALSLLQINMGSAACPAIKQESNGVAAEPSEHPNSVGVLQELALQRSWRLPEYAVLLEAGPPHRREFTVTCRMETLSETAVGNSKKAGKRAAANKMIAKLQSLSGCGEITWAPKPSIRLEDLRTSTAEKLSLLRRSPLSIPNTDYIQMMSEVATEQSFEVVYFNIDELTVNGQYQCLVELSTTPVTVCHGTGISCGNAQNDAAHSALQYVKIMASVN